MSGLESGAGARPKAASAPVLQKDLTGYACDLLPTGGFCLTKPRHQQCRNDPVAAYGRIAVAAAAVISFIAGWAWAHRTASAGSRVPRPFDRSPADGGSLFQDAPSGFHAVSPDGRNLAFISGANGSRHIWNPAARLTGGTGGFPAQSWQTVCSGHRTAVNLGFIANTKLLRIDLTTGAIKEIYNARIAVRGASWNAEGNVIFGTTRQSDFKESSADGARPSS
jgi:hypothetical protein